MMASLETRVAAVVEASLGVALEGVSDGAVEAGLPREASVALAHQSLLGAVTLLDDHTQSPAVLKDRVASPGGTTIAGLAALEEAGVRGAFLRAVEWSALAGEGGSK